MSNRPRPDQKRERIVEGLERNTHWASLSNKEKLASLDRRLGAGKGATRQRKKLAA